MGKLERVLSKKDPRNLPEKMRYGSYSQKPQAGQVRVHLPQ